MVLIHIFPGGEYMSTVITSLRKSLISFVYGNTGEYSLEHRLLLSTLVVGIVICTVGTISTMLFPKTPLALKIIPLLLLAIFLGLFYLVRVRKIIEPLLIPTAFLSLVGLSFVWILNGGIDGPNIIVFFVVLLLSLVIVPERKKIFVLLLSIVCTLSIYMIQLYRPDLITPIDPGFDRWADSLVTVLYCSVMVFFIVRFFHKEYTLERIKAEKYALQLQESNTQLSIINSSKDKFFSIIAHDLRSPFSGFLGLTKHLLEECEDLSTEDLQDFLKSLHESSSNLYRLLENLLEWSLVQRGAIRFTPEPCSLDFIVRQNIDVQTELAKQKNITLETTVENVQIQADVPMLNAIIRNLLTNAIKFTQRGGTISIGVLANHALNEKAAYSTTSNRQVCVFVKDSGIGMTPDIVSRLFKIDEKVSRPGTENEPSTGLGLILCKEFVHKHGGAIWAESEIHVGSTFYFTIAQSE